MNAKRVRRLLLGAFVFGAFVAGVAPADADHRHGPRFHADLGLWLGLPPPIVVVPPAPILQVPYDDGYHRHHRGCRHRRHWRGWDDSDSDSD